MVPSDADRDVEDGAAFSLDYVGHFVWSTLTLSEDYRRDVKFAETSLRAAQSAVQATGKPVKVETAIESGLSSVKLISESRDADLVCVGCTGMGGYARALLWSTAADVAEKAHCSVAVIRAPDGRPSQDINWVTVDGER